MAKAMSYRDRIAGFFQKRPGAVFRMADVLNGLSDINPSVVRYYVKQLVKDETLIKVSWGSYKWNSEPVKTIDLVREEILRLGKERVVQDPTVMFKPGEQVITSVENPKLILAAKCAHFNSLLERLKLHPAICTKYDLELLQELLQPQYRQWMKEDERSLSVAS